MNALPLVIRELRVQSRRRVTYRTRLLAAVVAIVLTGWMLLSTEIVLAPTSVGATLFDLLGAMAFLYCLFQGLGTTADCLSEEKREGTIGLLFLTDLRGYDVVLGKLASTGLASVYNLVAIVPCLSISFVLGGVGAGEFWRLVATLMATLFLSLAVGLFVSSLAYEDRQAWLGTLACLVGITALPLPLSFFGDWRINISPLATLLLLDDAAYGADPSKFWMCLSGVLVAGAVMLGLASVILPGAWRRESRPTRRAQRRETPAAEANRLRARSPKLDRNPVGWLAGRQLRSSSLVWMLILPCVISAIMLAIFFWERIPEAWSVLFMAALVVHFLLAMWVGSDACNLLAEARRSGALELVLSTPLTAARIIRGYRKALEEKFLAPILLLAAVEGILLVGKAAQWLILEPNRGAVVLVFLIVGFTVFVSLQEIWASAHFGLWMGLKHQNANRATFRLILYFLILPYVSACLWPLAAFVKNIVFLVTSDDRLRRELRRVGTPEDHSPAARQTWRTSKKREGRSLPPVIPPKPPAQG